MEKKIDLSIKGMHCASCSFVVEKAVKKNEGVVSASVNLATEKATIVFDDSKLSTDKIISSIFEKGYGASLIGSTASGKEAGRKESNHEEEKKKELDSLKKKFIFSLLFAIPAFIIGMVLMWLKIEIPYHEYILFILATPVQFISGWTFYKGAWQALKAESANMDTLIVVGTTAAYLLSIYNVIFNMEAGQYFEVSAILITLVLLGKLLEAKAKGRTSEAIKRLMSISPKTATVIREEKEVEIAIDDVLVGDIIIVKPGEKVAVDGIIVEGSSSIDESMVTGESMPVDKHVNDEVIGGTINKTGSFRFKATKVGENTTLSHIIRLIEDAQGKKAPIQRFADTVSGYFVPIIILLAIIAGLGWFFIGGQDASFSIIISVSVLVIACPCALGLATPTAIMVGTGLGAKYGILIKGGDSLETAHQLKYVVFDKTGTITRGKPEVTDIVSFNSQSEDEILSIAATIEKSSEHSLADAIVKKAEEQTMSLYTAADFQAIPGFGVKAKVNDKQYYLGNMKLMNANSVRVLQKIKDRMAELENEGKTVMLLSDGSDMIGLIAVADKVKESSKEAVQKLNNLGLEVYMITGDNEATAKAIGSQVGIKESNIFFEVLPQDKARHVKELQEKGKVAMIGDGINDSPALAQAAIGIAMGSGTDVALETGNIVLMRNDLLDVPRAVQLSKLTMGKIKQNMFWALFYNVLGIPIAAGILYPFTGWLLSPIIAGGAMAFSSVSVVSNSLLLKSKKL